MTSLAPIWRLVRRQQPIVVPLATLGSGPAFYCVHPIAGDVTSYMGLASLLQPTLRTFGIQVPSDMMEPEYGRSIIVLARRYVEAISVIQPSGPILLGGWSIGAVIALEMARQFRAEGRLVPLLIALDGAPCNTGLPEDGFNLPRIALRSLRDMPFHLRRTLQDRDLSKLSKRVMGMLRGKRHPPLSANGAAQTLDNGTVETLLGSKPWSEKHASFIRSLYNATMQYKPQIYDGRVLAIVARVQPFMRDRRIAPAWRAIARGVEISSFNCSHTCLLREPTLSLISAKIIRHLLYTAGGDNLDLSSPARDVNMSVPKRHLPDSNTGAQSCF